MFGQALSQIITPPSPSIPTLLCQAQIILQPVHVPRARSFIEVILLASNASCFRCSEQKALEAVETLQTLWCAVSFPKHCIGSNALFKESSKTRSSARSPEPSWKLLTEAWKCTDKLLPTHSKFGCCMRMYSFLHPSRYVRVLCTYIYAHIDPAACLSIYTPSIRVYIQVLSYLSFCITVSYLSAYPAIYQCTYQSVYLPVYLSIYLSIYPFVNPSNCSLCMCIYICTVTYTVYLS